MTEPDPLVHGLPRLVICALLSGVDWVDFATVRASAGVSDAVLSKHSKVLQDAGYLEIRKGAVGRRPRTWLRLTDEGRKAYDRHAQWLRALLGPG